MKHRSLFIAAATAVLLGTLAFALTPVWRMSGAAAPPSLASPGHDRLEQAVLAGLEPETLRSAREAVGAPTSVADRRAALGQLAGAIESWNTELAGELVSRWFQGPEPVSALFDAISAVSTDPGEVRALGLLLASAAELCRLGAPAVAPWDVASLADYALALVGAGDAVATVLHIGLASAGRDLPAATLADLLKRYGCEQQTPLGVTAQSELLHLGERWAADMPAEVEDVLFRLGFDPRSSQYVRGQAMGMLLSRDWRTFAPLIAEERAARSSDELRQFHFDLSTPMGPVVLSAYASRLPEHERGEFVASLATDPAASLQALEWLDPVALADFAVRFGADESIPEATRRMAVLLAGGEDAVDAGLALLRDGTGLPWQGDGQTILSLIQAGAWGHPDFEASLEAHFNRRGGTNRSSFWNDLAFAAQHLDDVQLSTAVLPFIERSEHEAHPRRRALIERLRERFPGASIR
jgi:hypothetical protein